MKNILLLLTSVLFSLTGTGPLANETSDGIIGSLRLGMTEAEVNEQYPEGKISLAGMDAVVEGRYGDFRRGDETFQNGMTMFKIRPAQVDSKEACLSFFDTLKPKMTETYSDPIRDDVDEREDVTAAQAAWEGPGLTIRLEAVWYVEQSVCSAELFVRPTDIEPL